MLRNRQDFPHPNRKVQRGLVVVRQQICWHWQRQQAREAVTETSPHSPPKNYHSIFTTHSFFPTSTSAVIMEDPLGEDLDCPQNIMNDFKEYLDTIDPLLLYGAISFTLISFIFFVLILLNCFWKNKIISHGKSHDSTPTTVSQESIPSSPSLPRKSNGGLESFASAQVVSEH
jgi:hypothetical protein